MGKVKPKGHRRGACIGQSLPLKTVVSKGALWMLGSKTERFCRMADQGSY